MILHRLPLSSLSLSAQSLTEVLLKNIGRVSVIYTNLDVRLPYKMLMGDPCETFHKTTKFMTAVYPRFLCALPVPLLLGPGCLQLQQF